MSAFGDGEAMRAYEAVEDEYEAAKKPLMDLMMYAVRQL